jgi:thiamine phosphate synthase YjbQ (UPF0047 family)
MRVECATIELETPFERGMVDLTPHVARVLREHDVGDGLLTLVSASPSCGLLVLEGTADVARGVGGLVEAVGSVPVERAGLDLESARPVFEAALAGATCSLPVAGGRLVIGHGNRLYLMECSGPGFRRVLAHILATSAIDHTVLETEGGKDIKAEDAG